MKRFLASISAGIFALAQTPPPASTVPNAPDPGQTIVLDVTRVSFLFTVSDKKGRFVTDLTKEDFEVFESKRPQEILEFSAETDLPLRLGVLFDTSNSIRDRFRFQQEAAAEFLRSAMRREDRAIIVGFDTSVELVADMTGDLEKLEKALKGLRPGGGTSLYDAIYFACRDKMMQDQPMHKFRRALVILSDGEDNQSRYTRDQALEMAQKADTVIYTISTNITRAPSDGDKVLKYFSDQTGGLYFSPFRATDLTQSFENIANELRSQYTILYRPNPLRTDGLFHEVGIRVKNRKDLIVRSRKGYFAPRS
jgi:Ca-activated chloride channel family protein